MKQYQFILDNLLCAHCAAKIEDKVRNNSNFKNVKFALATKKLQLELTSSYLNNHDEKLDIAVDICNILQNIVNSIEDGINVRFLSEEEKHNVKHHHHHNNGSFKNSLIEIIAGFSILIGSSLIPSNSSSSIKYLVILAFLIIGRYVFLAAVKNAKKGRFFDENFLMGLATIGAIGIGDYKEALGVMVFYRIGTMFEEYASNKSRGEILGALDMRPDNATILNANNAPQTIPAKDVKVGQIVLVKVGDRIPLDGTVVSGESRIDTSPVTGESKPVLVKSGMSVISGCLNTSDVLQIRVDKALTESFVTKILDSVEMATSNKPQVDRFITSFAKYYTPIVIAITILTMTIPPIISGAWSYWFYTGLTFLVISCPCAIVLSVPLSFFSGIGASSKLGILFKGGKSMDAIKDVKLIAMDKTGTITKGSFTVTEIESNSQYSNQELLRLCANLESISSHPIASSILEKAHELNISLNQIGNGQEIAGEGIIGKVDGHDVICGNRLLLKNKNVSIPNNLEIIDTTSEVLIAIDGKYSGRILIQDELKDDAIDSIRTLKSMGYKIALLSGDTNKAANSIAQKLNIDYVFAELLPQNKLDIVNNLQKEHGSVMFIGDGINDAPVLAGANVGCAMGSGADAALEASDVVFMNSDVSAICKAIKMARKTIRVAWENVWIALFLKALVMILGFLGYASLWMAIFADTGVLIICILNAMRLLFQKNA